MGLTMTLEFLEYVKDLKKGQKLSVFNDSYVRIKAEILWIKAEEFTTETQFRRARTIHSSKIC